MHQPILSLLPQRQPFLFVDRLINVNSKQITGVYTFNKNEHPLLHMHSNHAAYVPAMIIVESMAQCGGAGVRQLELTSGLFGLASIQKTSFLTGIPFDKEVKYVIENVKVGPKLVKQSGKAFVEGDLVLTATWICIKLP